MTDTRPDIPTALRVSSLRHGLIWTFAVIQSAFLAIVAAVYAYAEVEQNGNAFHDLGILLGRELMLSRVYEYWFLTGLGSAIAFTAIYFILKGRWEK